MSVYLFLSQVISAAYRPPRLIFFHLITASAEGQRTAKGNGIDWVLSVLDRIIRK
ncbi:hypothetical protein RHGRI_021502 [Rhododendron griersonianum]|uniref:Uncharacterized protein n=1 Tax=Rhododendron griersonianum TaxID=479676 RepID=A0AAV6ITS3_9ERIC|nr:hypothetical protein RHGRI_025741 [Rhododendron griersonianum]KAG5536476.1 hypothetical protein RHGRI_024041 [Rhododendron griersonianum]KAG5540119.1 hypothetical protein RHGRI_020374 [Rhododendron griersonianum]KAG5541693.1 hypothetical protein RHGRI_021502 [Rhododendron griersonianum]